MSLHNGVKDVNKITYSYQPIPNAMSGNTYTITQLSFNGFNWYKGSSANAQVNCPDLATLNNKVYGLFQKVFNSPLQWEGELLPTDNTYQPILIQLDENGNQQLHKALPADLKVLNFKTGSSSLYLSGYNTAPITVDTIAINHSAGADALALLIDTTFKAKNAFRLSSIYNEVMYDFDSYRDSLVSFAFTAQSNPTFSTARMSGSPADLKENAYVAAAPIKSSYQLDFFLSLQQNKVNLSWQVMNESDIKSYTLQRSEDNQSFKDISISNSGHLPYSNYSYVDELTKNGVYYYRIFYTEDDGKGHFSKTLKADYSSPNNYYVSFNATNSVLSIYMQPDTIYSWDVYDMQGRLTNKGTAKGNTVIALKNLASGKYIVHTQEKSGKEMAFPFLK